MCKELEAAGLRTLKYYSNSFMLQANIHNSNIDKSVIDDVRSDIRNQKPEIQNKKPEIQNEKHHRGKQESEKA